MALSAASIGLVLNHSHTKILLVKRADVSVWVLPGGGIDTNETAQAAAIREIKEETGLQVKIERQTAYYLPVNALAAPTSVFLCQVIGGQFELSSETKEIAFFPFHQLPSTLFPPHKKWIEEGLNTQEIIHRKLTEISYFSFMCLFLRYPFRVMRYIGTRLFMNKG